VIESVANGETVYIAEGEKDVLALEVAGYVATCNSGGAGKWLPEYNEVLAGADLVVIVDRDDAGARHAKLLEQNLQPVVNSIRFVQAKHGKDAFDHFEAGHSVDEFVPFAIHAPEPTEDKGYMTLAELYELPEEDIDWVVDELIPRGSLSLLIAKPKVGKSSILRELIRSILLGEPFLGRTVIQGKVIYLALEERKPSLKKFFKKMRVPATDDLAIVFYRKDCPDLGKLEKMIQQVQPELVVIDTLGRFSTIEDFNDYAKVNKFVVPLAELCRERNVAVLATHHSKKGANEDTGDSTLGSTALFGIVDTLLCMRKNSAGTRTLESEQRYGEPMEETIVEMNKETKRYSLGLAVEEVRNRDLAALVLEAIGDKEVDQNAIKKSVKDSGWHSCLKKLVEQGQVERLGRGGKNDPFRYRVAEEGSFTVPNPLIESEGMKESNLAMWD